MGQNGSYLVYTEKKTIVTTSHDAAKTEVGSTHTQIPASLPMRANRLSGKMCWESLTAKA